MNNITLFFHAIFCALLPNVPFAAAGEFKSNSVIVLNGRKKSILVVIVSLSAMITIAMLLLTGKTFVDLAAGDSTNWVHERIIYR